MVLALTLIGLIGAALLLLVLSYGSAYVIKRWQRRRLSETCVRQRALVLSFDDGPSEMLTPQVLSLLDRYQVKASFFSLGRQAHQHPRLMDQMKAQGHELACHSDQHLSMFRVPPWREVADMQMGFQRLKPWLKTGASYRPPYGRMSLPSVIALRLRGSRAVWWTHDSCDTHHNRPDRDVVVNDLRRAGGGVVLLHDHDSTSPEHAGYVLALTEALILMAQREGMQLCTSNEVLEWQGRSSGHGD